VESSYVSPSNFLDVLKSRHCKHIQETKLPDASIISFSISTEPSSIFRVRNVTFTQNFAFIFAAHQRYLTAVREWLTTPDKINLELTPIANRGDRVIDMVNYGDYNRVYGRLSALIPQPYTAHTQLPQSPNKRGKAMQRTSRLRSGTGCTRKQSSLLPPHKQFITKATFRVSLFITNVSEYIPSTYCDVPV
jgi:hypothetical protein